jgi:hypothetical protein
MEKRAKLPLALSVIITLSQTACSAAPSPPAQKAASVLSWTSPVTPPATPKGGVPCVDAGDAGEKGASAGGVRVGPFGQALRGQRGGVAKLWVAQDPQRGPADALIKVDHVESGTVAYYIRDKAAISTPLNDDGTPVRDPIYPGSVMLPAEGTVRITVTIGGSSGCFVLKL